MTIVKKYATQVISVGVVVAAVLTVAINLAGTLHLPAGTVAVLSAISGVVSAIVSMARKAVGNKVAARKAAKAAA